MKPTEAGGVKSLALFKAVGISRGAFQREGEMVRLLREALVLELTLDARLEAFDPLENAIPFALRFTRFSSPFAPVDPANCGTAFAAELGM